MTPYDLLVAASLLTAPADAPVAPIAPDRWPVVRTALLQTAQEREIIDPREARHLLCREEEYAADLALLRRRHAELAAAPLLADAARFPDRDTADARLRFNREYREHLEARQPWEADRADRIRSALDDTDRLHDVWAAVRDAQTERFTVTVRRQALNRLRTLLGPDAYAAGELPPNVPAWRFREVR